MNGDRKAAILDALRADDVADHYGIKGQWRGRWKRSARCARTDHSSDAFGIARDGMWHCWACDEGGDLLKLIAAGEKLDIRSDFPKVLDVAAKICGVDVEMDFGGEPSKPPPAPREPPPAPMALADRVRIARRRAAWVWDRLNAGSDQFASCAELYLQHDRGLDVRALRSRETIRDTPLRCSRDEAVSRASDLETLRRLFAPPAVAVPVRSPRDGAMVDVRVRRVAPKTFDDGSQQPKIVGMLGGVTSAPADVGRGRVLIGCYGRPHEIDADLVIVVEGLVDYLTALVLWPHACVLGAVEAGSTALVAGHAARALADRDNASRLVVVEQADGLTKQGKAGAADRSVNEDVNAASKVALRILGPKRVGWLFCQGAPGVKDLNDMHRAGVPIDPIMWPDVQRWTGAA